MSNTEVTDFFHDHAESWVLNGYNDDGYNYPVALHRLRIIKRILSSYGNSLEIGGKFMYSGGRRYTPIDTLLSAAAYSEVEDDTQPYTEQISDYMRLDLRVAFRRNKPKYYWMLSLDIQNATDKRNEQRQIYDPWLNELAWIYQSERIPALSFTIDF